MYRFVATCLFLLILSSCSTGNKEKQLQQMDSLSSKVDSLSNVYQQNAFDSLNYWRQEAFNIEIAIQRNYMATKVDPSLSKKMNRFKSLQEIIDAESELGGEGEYEEEEKEITLGRRMMLLNKGFKKETKSLDNLRSDIESNVLDDHKIATYLEQESNNVTRLENALNQYLFIKNTELKEYIKICQELKEFAHSLTAKTSEPK
ncbi:MAG: hypothetical protein ACKOXP_11415 [Flavobacteriales bacterium]